MFFSLVTIGAALLLGLALFWGLLRSAGSSDVKQRRRYMVIGVVLVIFGGLVTFWQAPELSRMKTVRSWPSCIGTVVDTEITGERASLPKVIYSYIVFDSVYQSASDLNVPGFGSRGYRKQSARKALANYSSGDELTVFYNPDNPAESTLLRAYHWAPLARLGLGGILLCGGIILVLTGALKPRNS